MWSPVLSSSVPPPDFGIANTSCFVGFKVLGSRSVGLCIGIKFGLDAQHFGCPGPDVSVFASACILNTVAVARCGVWSRILAR